MLCPILFFSGILVSQCDGVTHPSGPTKSLFLPPPFPFLLWGLEGKIAIVKGPLIKIRITLPNDAAVQPPTAPGLYQGTVDFTGWRVEMTGLAPKPSTSLLCASVSSCVIPTETLGKFQQVPSLSAPGTVSGGVSFPHLITTETEAGRAL